MCCVGDIFTVNICSFVFDLKFAKKNILNFFFLRIPELPCAHVLRLTQIEENKTRFTKFLFNPKNIVSLVYKDIHQK